jgi:hypothetical protein
MENVDLIHHKVRELRDETKQTVSKVEDEKGKALLETTFEVLAGLENAFDHYLHKTEDAWK